MRAPWPVPEERGAGGRWSAARLDAEADEAMAEVIGLVHAVRGMRANLGLTPTEPVPIVLACREDRRGRVEAARRYIAPLVRASELRVTRLGAAARPAGRCPRRGARSRSRCPSGSAEARAAVGQRLRKQLAGVERDLERLEARLQRRVPRQSAGGCRGR